MNDDHFICEDDFSFPEILAAVEAGEIIPWRTDAENRLWFERAPAVSGGGYPNTIRGVPSPGDFPASEDDGDNGIEADEYLDDDDEYDD